MERSLAWARELSMGFLPLIPCVPWANSERLGREGDGDEEIDLIEGHNNNYGISTRNKAA
jgi:hypothetical protein